jgi:tetratricopeptide (TPR) repeat protein
MLRARLLTDGGEYDSAWAALQTLPPANLTVPEHRQEYYYRAARIAHKKRLWPLALSLYQQTVALAPPERSTYFTPNAALQSGYIYQQHQPNLKLARRWFKQALSYEGYVYEQSIRQKAKDALTQMPQ